MSVCAKIKQKSLFKKKIFIEDVINDINLPYGICDENYRLIFNKIGKHTLIYDDEKLARGIDVSIEDSDIVLLLSLPTSSSEIRLFYKIIEKLCIKLKLKKYIREEDMVSIDDNERFIEYDEKASISGLEDLKNRINQDTYKRFEIFGVYNPISIGINEINQIGTSLIKFENFLHNIQVMDVYYAAPNVYKINDILVGIYAIGPNIPSVVPNEPYIVLNQIENIDEWYVMFKEGKTVKYIDFFAKCKNKKYYDANHVIVSLSDAEMNDLLENNLVHL